MDRQVFIEDLQLDEPTCIRLACLDNSAVSADSDLTANQSSVKNLDRCTRINPDVVATLIASLRTRVVELEGQWKQLSTSSGGRLTNAISEHRSIVSSSSEVQRSANDMAAAMQRLGGDFSERIHALMKLDVACTRMAETRALFDTIIEILSDIQHIYDSIAKEELYHAAKLYQSICKSYKGLLETATLSSRFEAGTEEEQQSKNEGDLDGQGDRTFLQDNINTVSPFLLGRLDDIEKQLDQKLSLLLTEWLTLSSSQTIKAGSEAMHICEMENDCRTLEYQQKQQCLIDMLDDDDAGSSKAINLAISCVANLKKKTDAIRDLEHTLVVSVSSILGLLKTSVLIKQIYSNTTHLLKQYVQARESQLGALLVPPESEEKERAYLAGLVGFFLFEISVYDNVSILGTNEFLKTIWEGASSAIVAEVGAMLDEASEIQTMLDLKSWSLFACQSLEKHRIEVIDTQPIRQIIRNRVGRYLVLLYDPTMASLEAAEGDTVLLAASVKSCLHDVTRYMEGLVHTNTLNHASILETEKLLYRILYPVLPQATEEGSYDNALVDGLLSFIETVDFIQLTLFKNRHHQDNINTVSHGLESLLNEGIRRYCEILATKTFADAVELIKSDSLSIRQKAKDDLISPWSDSIIEQFEFQTQEMSEFGFREETKMRILALYADKISLEICLYFQTYTGGITGAGSYSLYRDLKVLQSAFCSIDSYSENEILSGMITISKSIAWGSSEAIKEVKNSGASQNVVKFAIAILENVTNSPNFDKDINSLDRTTARKLAIELSSIVGK